MKKSFLSVLKEPVCGFFMAVADSVPGVSGGTVAFLAGVYGDFIGSFGNIVGKDKEKRKNLSSFSCASESAGSSAWGCPSRFLKACSQNIYTK